MLKLFKIKGFIVFYLKKNNRYLFKTFLKKIKKIILKKIKNNKKIITKKTNKKLTNKT